MFSGSHRVGGLLALAPETSQHTSTKSDARCAAGGRKPLLEAAGARITPLDRPGQSDLMATTMPGEARIRYICLCEKFKSSVHSIHCQRRPLVGPVGGRDNVERSEMP